MQFYSDIWKNFSKPSPHLFYVPFQASVICQISLEEILMVTQFNSTF